MLFKSEIQFSFQRYIAAISSIERWNTQSRRYLFKVGGKAAFIMIAGLRYVFIFCTNSVRLASLFGVDQVAAGHGNEFFQYTAPRQPKKDQGTAATGKLRD